MLEISKEIQIPDQELQFTFVKSSGPGGQNVNKVNTKAVLRWNILASPSVTPALKARFLERFMSRLNKEGQVCLASDLTRDRLRNQADCLEKLRALLLAVATPPRPRKKTKPSRASQKRRRESKKRRGEVKKGRAWRPD